MEAGEALRDADFVILPTASLEQHGKHLPLSVDFIRADCLVDEILRRSDEYDLKLVKLPVLIYGCSEHHMNFPGTITIRPENYIAVVYDIGVSLHRHGVKRFVIMNFHGGNLAPLNIAVQRIRVDTGMKTYLIHWTSFARDIINNWTKPGWGHACEHETSIILLYRPDLVRMDRIVKPKIKPRPPISSFKYFDEITDTGGIGDPARSSADFARRLVEEVTDKILRALRETLNID